MISISELCLCIREKSGDGKGHIHYEHTSSLVLFPEVNIVFGYLRMRFYLKCNVMSENHVLKNKAIDSTNPKTTITCLYF